MKRTAVLFAALVSLAMLAVACGGSDGDAGGTSSPATPTGDGGASPTDTGGEPSPTDGETSGETRLAMEDFQFAPADLTVTSGATLELDNEGQAPHTFTIEGQDIDVQVEAGQNGTATIDLPAGTYPFVCQFHEGQGMVGTLTVTA